MKLTRKQFCVLEALYEFDEGEAFDSSGFAQARLFNKVKYNTSRTSIEWGENISSILSWLESNKLIRRDINGKRTYRIRITKKGITALRGSDRLGGSQTLADDRTTLGVIEHIKSRLDEGWVATVADSSDEQEIIVLKASATTTQSRKLTKIRELIAAMYDGRITAPEVFHEIHTITDSIVRIYIEPKQHLQ